MRTLRGTGHLVQIGLCAFLCYRVLRRRLSWRETSHLVVEWDARGLPSVALLHLGDNGKGIDDRLAQCDGHLVRRTQTNRTSAREEIKPELQIAQPLCHSQRFAHRKICDFRN